VVRRVLGAAEQRGVAGAQLHELLVRSALDDVAGVEHEDLVGVADRRETVGDRDRRAAAREIVERLLFQLANVGAQLLEEGIALRAGDIDTVYVNGYGFPAWRGGPMWSVDAIGLETVVEKMHAYEKAHGPRFTPAPLMARLAAEGKSFNEGK